MSEADALLKRLERTSIAACVGMALIGAGVSSQPLRAAAGVMAGGALAAVSYRGLKSGTDALVGAMTGGGGGRVQAAIGLVKFFTRYAILAAAAYLALVTWRLPPMAVFAGASSVVVAIAIEAARQFPRGARGRTSDQSPKRPDAG